MDFINDDYANLMEVALQHKEQYKTADPFPNISFTHFFNPTLLDQVLDEFPDLEKKGDIKFNTPNEIKLASKGERRFGPVTKQFVHFLNSEPFLLFLQELTGIKEKLIPDPYFEGGGCHQTKRGGFLKIHADFNKHKETKLDRRLNILIYLNKDWKEDYGGHFELWNRDMTSCAKKVAPDFNTLAMFTTTDFSYHGLPSPLNCPPDRSRKSIALYYYSNGRPVEEINQGLEEHNTLFKARIGEDVQMRKYNSKQKIKELIKDFVPPVVTKLVKKVSNNNNNGV